MRYDSFSDLITAYLEEQLKGKASYYNSVSAAAEWIRTLTTTPTRADILARQHAICTGHFQPNATKANKELALIRAACRWGLYHERWHGGDPTLGLKKWKTPKRRRTGKFEELRKLLGYFDRASSEVEIRDRALYGLMLFTGCRPSEVRMARLDAMTPYGEMGCWLKGRTKTGENQEIPLPTQLMPWLEAWKAIRPSVRPSPYLFPGQAYGEPITSHLVRRRWHELRLILGIHGLWNYDLRRTLASYLSNDLKIDDVTIRAILNHSDGSALSHYCFKSFDSLVKPIQEYADWLWALRQESERQEPVLVAVSQSVPMPAPPVPPRPVIAKPLADKEGEEWCRRLSERETEVLSWLGQGRSVRHIAEALRLSAKTVSTYRTRLLDKLQLGSTGELMRFAIRNDSAHEDLPPSSAGLKHNRPRVAPSRRMIEREEWPG